MQQLLSNLVVNAIHYGARNEEVRIAVRGEEADVCIEVANRGPLIDPATLSQIFEPLRRGMSRDDQSGLGLGLYIVREVAKAHGGTAEARSDAKETVFAVRLPRASRNSDHTCRSPGEWGTYGIQAHNRSQLIAQEHLTFHAGCFSTSCGDKSRQNDLGTHLQSSRLVHRFQKCRS